MKKDYIEVIKSELNPFETAPQDVFNEEGWWSYYSAVNLDKSQDEITIDIPSSSYYIDPASFMIYVRAKVYKPDDTNPTWPVAPVNNFLHSCFKQVSLEVNDNPVENTNSTYPFKAYLLDTFNKLHHSKSFLASALYYKDDASEMDNITLTRLKSETTDTGTKQTPQTVNDGFIKRRELLLKGKGIVEMFGPIHIDLFNTDKLLLNTLSLKIKLWKADEKFSLMGAKDHGYKIYFEQVKIRVRHQHVSPRIMISHEKTLKTKPAIYPIKSTNVRIYPINIASLSVQQKICDGLVPDKIILGMIEPLAGTGTESKNPFNFKNFGLEYIKLRIDNQEKPYLNTINLNYEKNLYLDGYMTLFDAINTHGSENDISREDWLDGYNFFAFNLQPIITCSGEYLSSFKKAQITVELKFNENTLSKFKDISLVVFTDTPSEIKVIDNGDKKLEVVREDLDTV
jgi:hypothetical protein